MYDNVWHILTHQRHSKTMKGYSPYFCWCPALKRTKGTLQNHQPQARDSWNSCKKTCSFRALLLSSKMQQECYHTFSYFSLTRFCSWRIEDLWKWGKVKGQKSWIGFACWHFAYLDLSKFEFFKSTYQTDLQFFPILDGPGVFAHSPCTAVWRAPIRWLWHHGWTRERPESFQWHGQNQPDIGYRCAMQSCSIYGTVRDGGYGWHCMRNIIASS